MSQDINNTIATNKTRRVIKNLRWYILCCFLLGVTVNYITRNSGSRGTERASASTTEQYSLDLVGAFQIMPFSSPCAWLVDVIGLKIGFMVCAGIWALMCISMRALTGCTWRFCASLWVLLKPPLPRRTPKPLANVPEIRASVAAGWAGVGFPSARCWRRLSSTLLTPRSAGGARLCLPACWRCYGDPGGRSTTIWNSTRTWVRTS